MKKTPAIPLIGVFILTACSSAGEFFAMPVTAINSPQPRTTVINWTDASRGNPMADVACTSIILLGVAESAQTPNLLVKGLVKIFRANILGIIFASDLVVKMNIAAGYRFSQARLSEGIPEFEKWLVQQAGKVDQPNMS